MRSIRRTHHGLHAPPPPTPTWSWLVLAFMKRGLISQLGWNDPNSQRSRRPPAFACALLRNSFFFSNSCPLVFLFSSQQPHAPPTTSPSSVRRASTSPPLKARLLFGQVLCLSFSSGHRAALPGAALAEAPSITLIRTSKYCLTSSRHSTSAVHEMPKSCSG